MRVDWLIVGAGYSACVLAERIATQLGQRVLIVERRDHIGGNAALKAPPSSVVAEPPVPISRGSLGTRERGCPM